MRMIQAAFSLPNWLNPTHLSGMRRGIEKESLRMNAKGYLAQSPHPSALGSKLTHPHITTDYSEALLELITAPHTSIDAALNELTELHSLVFAALEHDELLWPLSMPCMLGSNDADIPLADYGTSNIGRLKTLYRMGLGLRYGRRMQTIAGLHYNLSFGDALFSAIKQATGDTRELQAVKNDAYLALIRNFKRFAVMVLYLLGASPSVCACFLTGRKHHLDNLNKTTLYLPSATSLRMGKLGYQNSAQDDLNIYYNDLPAYIEGLRHAVSQPHAAFTALGVDDEQGSPVQINDHILQIENEYYANIRPKQVANTSETPTHALQNRGIAYVELRAVDVDPYSCIGISPDSAYFLEVLALYCLLHDSPPLLDEEEHTLSQNQDKVVNDGRNPELTIRIEGSEVRFHDWLANTLNDMQSVATLLDAAKQSAASKQADAQTATKAATPHSDALAVMLARAKDPNLTPSAKVLADTKTAGGTWQLGSTLARRYAQNYTTYTLSPEKQVHYADLAASSLAEQTALEAEDGLAFYEFLQQYR